MMLPIPAAGTLRAVAWPGRGPGGAGCHRARDHVPNGRPVVPLPEGDRYLGFLFARGDTPDGVEAALRSAHDALEVIIDP